MYSRPARGANRGRGGRGGREGRRGRSCCGEIGFRSSSADSITTDIRKTQILEEIHERLAYLGLEIGNPNLHEKKPAGTEGVEVKIRTNVFGVRLANAHNGPIYRYDIIISGELKGSQRVKTGQKADPLEFTKRSNDDAAIVHHKDYCRTIWQTIFEKYKPAFGENPKRCYYDLASILYTLDEIDLGTYGEQKLPRKTRTFILKYDECKVIEKLANFYKVTMLVKPVKEFRLQDLKFSTDTTQQDHTLEQFIELATSQLPLFQPKDHVIIEGGTSYFVDSTNYGFTEEDNPTLSQRNKWLAVGIHKSTRYVEGPFKTGTLGVIVESRKTPFHVAGWSLIQKAEAALGMDIPKPGRIRNDQILFLNREFKGLFVDVHYNTGENGEKLRKRTIRVDEIVGNTPCEHIFEVNREDGGKYIRTVEQYFLEKYRIILHYYESPMVTTYEDNNVNFYPMELCYIVDNQRAKLSQLKRAEIEAMIEHSAVPPEILWSQIKKGREALQLDNDNEWLETANIRITAEELPVNARVLKAPAILYKSEQKTVAEDGSWNVTNERFLVPATITNWACFYLSSAKGSGFTRRYLQTFVGIYMKKCQECGITMPEPFKCYVLDDLTKTPMSSILKNVYDNNCDFLFFITADDLKETHAEMKYFEQQYGIVTQDLKMTTALNIAKHGPGLQDTLRNIVAKTNEKLGGLNYSLRLRNEGLQQLIADGTLFIGLAINHPGALNKYARGDKPTAPSVIGYAANVLKNPFNIIGDFAFDEARRDEMMFNTLPTIFTDCIERYQENNNNKSPKRLVILRGGSSEGQFATILQYEIPLIQKSLVNLMVFDCKIVLIVSQKAHNVRLFLSEEEMDAMWEKHLAEASTSTLNQNIKPGTVVDSIVTHPAHCEFYLNSHMAIKGTSRTPRYTVLLDEAKLSSDQIQGMMHALCYGYQITNSPISLPAPVYIAQMYAKRGRNNFNVNKNDLMKKIAENGEKGFEKVTKLMRYWTNDEEHPRYNLRSKRTNA